VKTFDLNEAAAFLHMHPEEVRTRARRGLIPGAKAGRRWVFLEPDLADFVRSQYPVGRQALQVTGGSMSLRKLGSVWWIDIATPSGERVRRSAETGIKAQAQELHDKLRSELWRLQKLGDRPRRIWQDAAVRWLREQASKASLEDDKEKLRWLDRHLADRELESINRALIDAITEAKRAEGCSNATVNRTLALIRAILRKCARDWDWLDRAPAVRLLKEPTRRIRFLSRHQARAAARAAESPSRDGDFHADDGAARGERDGTHLGPGGSPTQARVDTSGPGEGEARDRRAAQRDVDAGPANAAWQASDASVHVRGSAHQTGQHGCLVQGAQARRYRGFRWHDLRHAWASWHVQGGTPLFGVQELAGWETEKMVRRYAHLAAEHLAVYAGNTESHGTSTAQAPDFRGTARVQLVGK
jgi:integrase